MIHKDKVFAFRLTDDQKTRLKQRANNREMSVSQYIIQKTLQNEI